jgi:hypothetical protein
MKRDRPRPDEKAPIIARVETDKTAAAAAVADFEDINLTLKRS